MRSQSELWRVIDYYSLGRKEKAGEVEDKGGLYTVGGAGLAGGFGWLLGIFDKIDELFKVNKKVDSGC